MIYDAEVYWLTNETCNFNCEYCWLYGRDKAKFFGGHGDIDSIVNGFNNQGITWLIHMSGGEPFLTPQFIDLCRKVTQRHFISIATNLSTKNVYAFADSIDPSKVAFLHASLHVSERIRLKGIDEFIKKIHYLQDKGFFVFASYLMHPQLIKSFDKYYVDFKSQGVILHPKVFWGLEYSRLGKLFESPFSQKVRRILQVKRKIYPKKYPDGYRTEEKDLIRRAIKRSIAEEGSGKNIQEQFVVRTADLRVDENFVDSLPSFKGRLCRAGKDFVKMEKDGKVYRCNDEQQYYLGDMFKEKIKFFDDYKICNANVCTCPYVGFRYVHPHPATPA